MSIDRARLRVDSRNQLWIRGMMSAGLSKISLPSPINVLKAGGIELGSRLTVKSRHGIYYFLPIPRIVLKTPLALTKIQ